MFSCYSTVKLKIIIYVLKFRKLVILEELTANLANLVISTTGTKKSMCTVQGIATCAHTVCLHKASREV